MISEFSLFVFTLLGGLGAGMYATAAVFPVKGKRSELLVSIVPLVLLGIGGVALMLHLGRPERALNAFANLEAGITKEALGCMAFGIVLVIDLVLSFTKGAAPRALRYVGAVVAIVLCILMGLAYYAYESVSAWHAWPTFALFLCGDLAAGVLLLGALCPESTEGKAFMGAAIALAVIAAVAFAVEGVHFAGVERDLMPFACAAVVAAAGAGVAFLADKKSDARLYWAAFALVFVAVIVARYAFYSVV